MTDLDTDASLATALSFVIVRPSDPEYAGRARIRSTVLGLRPVADAGGPAQAPMGIPGVTWKLVAPNGLTMAMRARDFASEDAARADIARVCGRGTYRSLTVRDAGTGRMSFWVLEGRRVVVVGVRVLPPTRRSMLRYETERVLRALREGPVGAVLDGEGDAEGEPAT